MRYVPLGSVGAVLMGVAPPTSECNTEEIGLPLIAGAGDFGEIHPKPKKWTTHFTRVAEPGDLMICVRATIGDLNMADRKYVLGRGVAAIRPLSDQVYVRYLWHVLKAKKPELEQMGTGSTFLAIRRESLENLSIPLPDVANQRRIAEVLDRAETLRRQRQSALDWLSMLVDVMFAELFQGALSAARWPIVRLGDVAAIQGGLQLSGKRAALPIEVPYLRVANVYRGYIDLTEVKTLRATPEEVSRTRLLANDLLIVEGHGNATEIGRCALWDGSVDPCVHQNHLIRVRVDQERLDPVFLCHYLNSPQGRQHLLRSAKTTSGLNTISTSNVKETPVVVPPMSLQKQFVERVTRVERVRATNLASLAQLEALYASLQHRAFRGEL